MAKYAIGIKPLIDNLRESVDTQKCQQVWYADDSSSAGKLTEMKIWWEKLCLQGPHYGYYPLASKTILIAKKDYEDKAKEVFGECGVTITTHGERHMGAVIGSEDNKMEYVAKKGGLFKFCYNILLLRISLF